MLRLLRSFRAGNWHLHLYTIDVLVSWCFAYDRQNYAKYMWVYNSQMTRLPEEHPKIYKYFTGGGFSVQISKETLLVEYLLTKLSKKPLTKIPQTAGGTEGFSTKPSAVSKYHLNAEYISTAIKQLCSVIEIDSPHDIHSGLQPPRVKKYETDV